MKVSKDIEIVKNIYEYTAQKKDGREGVPIKILFIELHTSMYLALCTVCLCLEAGLEL